MWRCKIRLVYTFHLRLTRACEAFIWVAFGKETALCQSCVSWVHNQRYAIKILVSLEKLIFCNYWSFCFREECGQHRTPPALVKPHVCTLCYTFRNDAVPDSFCSTVIFIPVDTSTKHIWLSLRTSVTYFVTQNTFWLKQTKLHSCSCKDPSSKRVDMYLFSPKCFIVMSFLLISIYA